ncbi:SH3 domain-containing protein [Lysobacter soyae]|uniref:SH3 domain-containing protein n=1 Tax=Lysobacter soyae TaxID=2764185 RepID=A0ABX8WNJ4_9GAMM|nr:SH3 domain-containing protein [Lysobacter sp. CJ11]QYR52416.1 SH3 domain-containing protein [Lysobacter sp. CJ11]
MRLALAALCLTIAGCASVQTPAPTSQMPTAAAPYTLSDIKAPAAIRNGSAGLQVPGVTSAMLLPTYWIQRIDHAETVTHDAAEIAALNAETGARSSNLYALIDFPATLRGAEVSKWITSLSNSAKPALIDQAGNPLGEATVARMAANTNLSALPTAVSPRWATVVERADLRAVPTSLRAYRKTDDIPINIDRLQESAVFPGWAVLILHTSADGEWAFVNAYNYRAWMPMAALRLVDREIALARNAAVQPRPLGYSRANLIRTAFQYLGESYGWGHADGTRDCSGFVSEVYAALGVVMPRNTGDQRDVPTFQTRRFTATEDRTAAVAAALPGDLIYIPGHVMMVLGHVGDETYVIHDTPGVRWADGRFLPLYGVSVTPFSTLMADAQTPYSAKIEAIVRPLP